MPRPPGSATGGPRRAIPSGASTKGTPAMPQSKPLVLVLISDKQHPAGREDKHLDKALDHLLQARDLAALIVRDMHSAADLGALYWANQQGIPAILLPEDWRDADDV